MSLAGGTVESEFIVAACFVRFWRRVNNECVALLVLEQLCWRQRELRHNIGPIVVRVGAVDGALDVDKVSIHAAHMHGSPVTELAGEETCIVAHEFPIHVHFVVVETVSHFPACHAQAGQRLVPLSAHAPHTRRVHGAFGGLSPQQSALSANTCG